MLMNDNRQKIIFHADHQADKINIFCIHTINIILNFHLKFYHKLTFSSVGHTDYDEFYNLKRSGTRCIYTESINKVTCSKWDCEYAVKTSSGKYIPQKTFLVKTSFGKSRVYKSRSK
jgi:hypothetical protein